MEGIRRSVPVSLSADSQDIVLSRPPALSPLYTLHKAPADGHNKIPPDQPLCTRVVPLCVL